MKRRILAAALAVCLLLAVPAAAAPAKSSYPDVPEGDWSIESIEKAREYGLMQGGSDGGFGFNKDMTRGEFVTVLRRMFGWEEAKPEAPSFSDVKSGDWFYSAVEAALVHGAIDAGLYFNPKDPISRQDMAVMLIRALGYQPLADAKESAALPFDDVAENRGYIALAYSMGVISGIPQGGKLLFQPTKTSTRQETAAMLVRTYERYTSKTSWLHGFYAQGSYGQIACADSMDGVSLGWSRISVDPEKGPYLNQSSKSGNEWAVPQQSELATGHLTDNKVPYNLSVYASASDKLTLGGTSTSSAAAAISTAESRTQTVEAIVDAAADYAGVTIDFENLRDGLKEPFTAFMTQLRAALPAGKTLFVCVQPLDWFEGYDYRTLGNLCDKVILMAHDYHDRSLPAGWVGTGQITNPPAPLNKVYDALAAITDPNTGVADRSKIALAISFTSVGLKLDKDGKLAETTIYSPAPDTIVGRLRQSDTVRGWDDTAATPYADYTAEGDRYRLWYEDARSVSAKMQLARMFGVGGVSLWRLGTIPNYGDAGLDYDVWSAVLAAE